MVIFYATLWIDSVILILFSECLFSFFSQLSFGAWTGFAASLALSAFRIHQRRSSALCVPRPHGLCEWGLALLLALVFLSLCAAPHCFLDSYTYRFPQMLFWLQEGHPWSVPNVDMRINQMPHVWPMLSAAFFLPFGERGVALPNFISYLLLVAIIRKWAALSTQNHQRIDALTIIAASAPVFLMGASSNDNVVSCVAFLSISLHFALSASKSGPNDHRAANIIVHSALAFSLCCGIKPQYLVLAPVWFAWFFFGPSRPYRQLFQARITLEARQRTSNGRSLHLLRVIVVLVALILCSPIPTMAWNQIRYGSFKSPHLPNVPEETTSSAVSIPISHSYEALALQLFEFPANPLFAKANAWIRNSETPLAREFRIQGFRFRPLTIPETASLGFLLAIIFFYGTISSLFLPQNRIHGKDSVAFPHRSLIVSTILCLSLAIYVTRAGTLGRSFIGFFVILFPSMFNGIPQKTSPKVLSAYGLVSILLGCFIVLTDSSCPLWPVKTVSSWIHSSTIKNQLHDYAHYSRRQIGANELLRKLPAQEHKIGIIVSSGCPIAECWLGRESPTTVVPYNASVSSERLETDGIRYLLIKHSRLVSESDGTLKSSFLRQINGTVIAQNLYTSYMNLGDEPWFLVQRFSKQGMDSSPTW